MRKPYPTDLSDAEWNYIEPHLPAPKHFSMESFSDLEEDVRQSIARIQASPFVPNKDSVRGFIYEVETGRLREVT
jgi:carbonic anhydrase